MIIERLPRDFYSRIKRYVIKREDGTELKVGCTSYGEDIAGEPIDWKITEITESDPKNSQSNLHFEIEFDNARNPSEISYWVYYDRSRRFTPYRQIITDGSGNTKQDIYTEQEMTRKLIIDEQGYRTWVPYYDFINDGQNCPENKMTDPELGSKLVKLNKLLVQALNKYENSLNSTGRVGNRNDGGRDDR